MKCEKCNKDHDGSYGSGRFCSSKCARSFSTSKDTQNELKDATCPKCGKKHKIRKRASEKLTYCIDCGGNDPTIEREKEKCCLYCGKRLIKDQRKYCCHKCQYEYKYYIWLNKWKLGLVDGIRGDTSTSRYIKKYLFEKYNNKCKKCGWDVLHPVTKKSPLEIHHIDGNYKNNNEENLELLCPNCHSLTDNYGSLNMNKSTRTF